MDNTLPMLCAATLPTTGEPIFIKRGEIGYWRAPGCIPDQYNARHGVTPSQVEAMTIGSCFGWDVPGAYASTYETLSTPEK